MKHGFVKVAAATPKICVASCDNNLTEILRLTRLAENEGAHLTVFPELSLCGSTCQDLLFSDVLLTSVESSLGSLLKQTTDFNTTIIIGFPFVVNNNLYNCAAFCKNGQILGVIPKTFLTNDEKRYFSLYTGDVYYTEICGQLVPFGAKQLFDCESVSGLTIGIQIGSEALSLDAPSTLSAKAGATVIATPFSQPELVGSEEYRRLILKAYSAKQVCGYVVAMSGDGESTTDGVYGGHRMIIENGHVIAESKPFDDGNGLTISEIDIQLLAGERRRSGFSTSLGDFAWTSFGLDTHETTLTRKIPASPFVPECKRELDARCEKILTMQAKGLAQRITKAYASKAVIGISGGLDSCLAMLVAAKAMDILGRPRTDIVGVTMPCFGTTARTKSNAEILCSELGTSLRCINIGNSVKQHFSDIGHNENEHNVVYENAQARERTQVLMDIANMENGLVVGTGDLSELVLGWATYNGDHMSMYGVNGGVPKTLIRHVVAFCARSAEDDGKNGLANVLFDILDTPVSPELLPADKDGNIAQKTEDLVGPYEIHDFYIYYTLRYGFAPDKLYRMAKIALGNKYSDEELLKWLKNFAKRLFSQQFKRSCLPDGVKIGTVGVSPRGDLRMPSDASSAEWLKIIETL